MRNPSLKASFLDEENFSYGFYTLGNNHDISRYDADDVRVTTKLNHPKPKNDNLLWDIDQESLRARLLAA